jgi:hypothetical protein
MNLKENLKELAKYYFDLYSYYLAIGIQGEELHEALMNWVKYDKLSKEKETKA